jgi:hypothetical protein
VLRGPKLEGANGSSSRAYARNRSSFAPSKIHAQQPGVTHTAFAPLIRQLFCFAASSQNVGHVPKAAEELRQPLLLAMCLGFRLDCLQAHFVRSALRATIGPRPDAAPRALTAGLFSSRSFFNRLDWHSHSRPPRFASPIVALMSSRINPVLLRIRRSNLLRLDLKTDFEGYLECVYKDGNDAPPFPWPWSMLRRLSLNSRLSGRSVILARSLHLRTGTSARAACTSRYLPQ